MKVSLIALTFGFFLVAGLLLAATAEPTPGDGNADVDHVAMYAPTTCDANGDGCVTARDYIIMAQELGNTNPPGPTRSDCNGDTIVDQLDIISLAMEWLNCE